jgi:hypothetical protein
VENIPRFKHHEKHGLSLRPLPIREALSFGGSTKSSTNIFNLLRDVSLKERRLGWVFERKIDEINEIYFNPINPKA